MTAVSGTAANAASAANTANKSSSSSSSSSSTGSNALADLSNNFQTFLTLLTTQLQNQDPTSPEDTNTLTQQLVSMSGVEQQIQTNQGISNIYNIMSANQNSSALNYMGKYVEYTGNSLSLQNSTASLSINYPTAAANATLTVYDSNNKLVSSTDVSGTAGTHNYSWNGTDSNGNKLADGTYTFKVTAKDANGLTVTPTVLVAGQVTGVDTSGSTAALEVGSLKVPLSSVSAVLNPGSGSSSS